MKKTRILLLTTSVFCEWGRRSLQVAALCSSVLTTSNISASISTADVQKAYVAFFNRPADVAGLNYWSNFSGGYADLLNNFGRSPEYQSTYPKSMSNEQMVNTLYHNLFGRDADTAGLNFWVGQLNSGQSNWDNLAFQIAMGAHGDDATVMNNKVAAATLFTEALAISSQATTAYDSSSGSSLSAVKNWLAGVGLNGVTDQSMQAVVSNLTNPPHAFSIEVSNNAAATATVKTTNSSGTTSSVNLNAVSGTSGLSKGEIGAATAQSVTITTGVGQTVTLNDKTTGASVVNATGAAVITVNTGSTSSGTGETSGGGSGGGVFSATIDLTGKVQASYSYSNSVPTMVTLSDTMLYDGDLTSSGSNSDTINASGTNAITGSINMGAGEDTINASGTNFVSSINMGAGDDRLNVTDGTTTVLGTLKGEAGDDTINVTGGALKSGTISGVEIIKVDSGGVLTNLGDGAVVVDVNDLVENKLTLQGSGAQTLILTDSDDGNTLTAIDGGSRTAATTLTVNNAVESITTGSGDDTITLDSTVSKTGSATSIAGGDGADKLVVKANASTDLNALTAVSGMETLEIDCTSIASADDLAALVAKLADTNISDLNPDQWKSITFSNVHDDFSETTIDLSNFSNVTSITVTSLSTPGNLSIIRPGEFAPTGFSVGSGGEITSTYTDPSWDVLP